METIEGIVLNETNYRETSKILNILTPKYGYISVLSRGSRTIKSKLRGVSMKFINAECTINYKKNSIISLTEGNLLNSFSNIMKDYNKMFYANLIINLVKSILKENNDTNIYLILKQSLIKINDGFEPSLIYNILALKLLDYLGVRPDFSSCINCGSQDILTFDLSIPGSICKNCYNNTYLFNKNTLKILKLFQNVDIEKIDKLNIKNPKILEELDFFTKEYYESFTGIYYNVR